jgi:hypothetical protein
MDDIVSQGGDFGEKGWTGLWSSEGVDAVVYAHALEMGCEVKGIC